MVSQKALLIGISGVSSSGKTTLARLLRDIIPDTFILHEDDFYKTDAEIPVKDGVADWDCLESLNLPQLKEALAYIKTEGKLPEDLFSKEDKNSVGESGVDRTIVEDLKQKTHASLSESQRLPVAIIDGFLLFSEDMKDIRDLFDIKLLLRTDYKTAKARREARSGYVTLEGFWEDPPGYVDNIVWPNYVKDHAFLFHNGDVEGKAKEGLCDSLGIAPISKDAEGSMTACLQWAYSVIMPHLEQRR
ncbi:ribosylnicotinamide kinase [Zalaria obscura]|uniref:Ribosylnicotinamide kinase n=1 Tax=Zalaria obscura TaxID=2024903 RepID=A0ACC3SKM6_9PEZI